jgi:hypothetical protein
MAKLRSVLMWIQIRAVIIEDEPLAAQLRGGTVFDQVCRQSEQRLRQLRQKPPFSQIPVSIEGNSVGEARSSR